MDESNEYKSLMDELTRLQGELRELQTESREKYIKLNNKKNWWQTAVVVSGSISTGLAGYMAHEGIDLNWRMGLAITVALAGTVAAIRDAWQVNEALVDAKERYSEIRWLLSEIEKAEYEAQGLTRDSQRLPVLEAVARHVKGRLNDLRDEVAEFRRVNRPGQIEAGHTATVPPAPAPSRHSPTPTPPSVPPAAST